MKKLLICMSAVLSIVFAGSTAFAGSGSAIIPSWRAKTFTASEVYSWTQIDISNITNNTVTIYITFYDDSGSLVTDSSNSQSSGNITAKWLSPLSNYQEVGLTNKSVKFDLGANETIDVSILNSVDSNGYGIIEWEPTVSTRQDTVALVAVGEIIFWQENLYRNSHYVPINNGLPF